MTDQVRVLVFVVAPESEDAGWRTSTTRSAASLPGTPGLLANELLRSIRDPPASSS